MAQFLPYYISIMISLGAVLWGLWQWRAGKRWHALAAWVVALLILVNATAYYVRVKGQIEQQYRRQQKNTLPG